MTPGGAYRCIEAVLGLPLPQQAVCVRLAADASAPDWRQWCERRGMADRSCELLGVFDRWLSGAASGEELAVAGDRLYETLPHDLHAEAEPAGGYAGTALLDIALIALDLYPDVHHSIVYSSICYAAAADCRVGIEAATGTFDRMTVAELAFVEQWWRRCCEWFPELTGTVLTA